MTSAACRLNPSSCPSRIFSRARTSNWPIVPLLYSGYRRLLLPLFSAWDDRLPRADGPVVVGAVGPGWAGWECLSGSRTVALRRWIGGPAGEEKRKAKGEAMPSVKEAAAAF